MFNLILQKTKKAIETKLFTYSNNDNASANRKKQIDNTPVFENDEDFKQYVYDVLKTIQDPEKDATLEDLNVIQEEHIYVTTVPGTDHKLVRIEFVPTIPHCSLATLIGLCLRVKLQRAISEKLKVDIFVKPGSHNIEEEVNKQVNDKERVAAAMENPNLKKIVERCIKED